MTPAVTVRDNTESRSYDALLDGRVVGSIVYEHEGQRIVFTHTIVEPEFRSQGIATTLTREALDDVRAKGVKLTNYCSFVSEFIGENPEYADLLDEAHPGHIRRPS
jgi:hypothetical protein